MNAAPSEAVSLCSIDWDEAAVAKTVVAPEASDTNRRSAMAFFMIGGFGEIPSLLSRKNRPDQASSAMRQRNQGRIEIAR